MVVGAHVEAFPKELNHFRIAPWNPVEFLDLDLDQQVVIYHFSVLVQRQVDCKGVIGNCYLQLRADTMPSNVNDFIASNEPALKHPNVLSSL